MATDGGPPVVLSGAPQGSNYIFMGDEHGLIIDPTQKHVWSIGDIVRLAVPHCDPTVNLYDAYHVVSGEDAAGRVAGKCARAFAIGNMARIEHIALWVDDLDALSAFYARAFGAQVGRVSRWDLHACRRFARVGKGSR